LHGVVAAYLVVGAPVRWPEVDALEAGSIGRYPERDPDKSPSTSGCPGPHLAGELYFDRATLEFSILQNGQSTFIACSRWSGVGHPDRLVTFEGDGLRLHVDRLQPVGRIHRNRLRLSERQARDQGNDE